LGEAVVLQAVHVARAVDESVTMKEIVRQQREEEYNSLREAEHTFAEMRSILMENDFLREKLENELKGKKKKTKEMQEEDRGFGQKTLEWRREMMKNNNITSFITEQLDGTGEGESVNEDDQEVGEGKEKQVLIVICFFMVLSFFFHIEEEE
jgi:hypothetical protein